MQPRPTNKRRGLLFLLTVTAALLLPNANAASCKTGSQMTTVERDALATAARTMAEQVQSGNVQALQANTIPPVAANFGGIAASVDSLRPLVQQAAITVDDLYGLDASTEPVGTPRTDFYCGTPLVVLNITNLPPGKYALAIVHATGVPQPQQIALVLSETAENQWKLAGFFSRPMIEAGHNGIWYWTRAREYAQKKMDWDAWFYYQAAASLLDPVEFLSSPNLDKLHREADAARPNGLPGTNPIRLDSHGAAFAMTGLDTTGALGGLDLEVYYAPDAAQLAQLRDPVAARRQAIDVMTALLATHPELREAFHGIWVHANQGNASVFALDLPMNEIAAGTQPAAANSSPAAR